MSTPASKLPSPGRRPHRRRARGPTALAAYGEPMVWLTGGALVAALAMVVGLLLLVAWMGLGTFWPAPIERIETSRGEVLLGEVSRTEWFTPESGDERRVRRRLFRTGNYELTQRHFVWVADGEIRSRSFPEWAMVIERTQWGRFYGEPRRFLVDGEVLADTPAATWRAWRRRQGAVAARRRRILRLNGHDLGRLRGEREDARLAARAVVIDHALAPAWARAYRRLFEAERRASGEDGADIAPARGRLARLEAGLGRPPAADVRAYRAALEREAEITAQAEARGRGVVAEINHLQQQNRRAEIVLATSDGREQAMTLDQVVRAYPANRLGWRGKLAVYGSRWWEFLTAEPREANSEGGVFPAIVGTVLMTLIMAVLVVPFGVLAALYLREYARGGMIVSAVRIAINNLAGVPSIVFGVFGLGFFCYGVGGFIDGGPSWSMPRPVWFAALAATAAVAAAAFATALRGGRRPGPGAGRWRGVLRRVSGGLWLASSITALVLIVTCPFFHGFFSAALPNPTFGKGALIWASFTLALLTVPVVVVATEEALAAVPNSMRVGSVACGASQWQTIRRIVLPQAMPGIMTGTILAMARGAGEVAPLMLVGAVKLAGELPLSFRPHEHFGIDRSFMHLGFHIYDLGFQSQNSEAARPMIYTTTLLLIAIIATVNIVAVALRARLRRKYVGARF